MNTIAILKKHIAEATTIADRYKAVLSKKPANIAYELSLATIEKHIDELQIQLKSEKEIRDKDPLISTMPKRQNKKVQRPGDATFLNPRF